MNWRISSQDNYGIEIRYEKNNILGTNSCITSNKNYKLVV